jgi:hypothetical protein
MKSIMGTIGGLAGIFLGLISLASGIGFLFFTQQFIGLIAAYVLPFINVIGLIGMAASVLLGLPFLFFRRMAGTAEAIFAITAMVVGLSLSLWSLLLIYQAWGKFFTIFSVLLLPITPVLAGIAQAFEGRWDIVGMLALNIVVWLLLIGGASFAGTRR